MSSPAIRPLNSKPAAGQGGKTGPQQALRVLSEQIAARAARPNIAMPRPKTELSELLAGDNTLCLRRRASVVATQPNTEARSGTSACADPLVESPPAPTDNGDLAHVIEAWPDLPEDIRATVMAMIRGTPAGEES
jgi:hypothetical protein